MHKRKYNTRLQSKLRKQKLNNGNGNYRDEPNGNDTDYDSDNDVLKKSFSLSLSDMVNTCNEENFGGNSNNKQKEPEKPPPPDPNELNYEMEIDKDEEQKIEQDANEEYEIFKTIRMVRNLENKLIIKRKGGRTIQESQTETTITFKQFDDIDRVKDEISGVLKLASLPSDLSLYQFRVLSHRKPKARPKLIKGFNLKDKNVDWYSEDLTFYITQVRNEPKAPRAKSKSKKKKKNSKTDDEIDDSKRNPDLKQDLDAAAAEIEQGLEEELFESIRKHPYVHKKVAYKRVKL